MTRLLNGQIQIRPLWIYAGLLAVNLAAWGLVIWLVKRVIGFAA